MTGIVFRIPEDGGVLWGLGVVFSALAVSGIFLIFMSLARKLQRMDASWAMLPIAVVVFCFVMSGFVLSAELFLDPDLKINKDPLFHSFAVLFNATFVLTCPNRSAANFTDRIIASGLVERSLKRLLKKTLTSGDLACGFS